MVIGIPITIFGSRVMASKLFGVTPHDSMVLAVTAAVLAGVAFIAAAIPARRAAKTEPMPALRME